MQNRFEIVQHIKNSVEGFNHRHPPPSLPTVPRWGYEFACSSRVNLSDLIPKTKYQKNSGARKIERKYSCLLSSPEKNILASPGLFLTSRQNIHARKFDKKIHERKLTTLSILIPNPTSQ